MIIKLSDLFKYLKGGVGNLVFYPHKRRPGYLIGRRKGCREKPPKAGELASQGLFADGMVRAKTIMAHPETAAIYRAFGRLLGRDPFRVAVSDCLKAPEVQDIALTGYTGKPGESILIKPFDTVDVADVLVRILGPAGAVLEQGKAFRTPGPSGDWAYVAQTEIAAGQLVSVEVTVSDLPGNKALKQVDHLCGPRPVAP